MINERTDLYGIDISAFGDMYADKITLMSTDNDVGIRNNGAISASIGGLILNAEGALINSHGLLESEGDVTLTGAKGLNNDTGTIDALGSVSANIGLIALTNQ